MMDERFAQGNSILHKLNPKVKVITAFTFIAVAAVSSSFVTVALALTLALSLILISKLPLIPVAKRLLAANSFTFFLWLTLPLTYGGESLTLLGFIPFSVEGLRLAALITLKTNIIVLSLISLLGTSPIASLGHALEELYVPSRLCFLLLFSYRYVFVIFQEYNKLLRAAKMRSFSPSTNIHTYRTYGYLFGMTLVRSYNRGYRVQQAMLLRGFNGQLIPLHQLKVTRFDLIFISIFLTITLSIATLPQLF